MLSENMFLNGDEIRLAFPIIRLLRRIAPAYLGGFSIGPSNRTSSQYPLLRYSAMRPQKKDHSRLLADVNRGIHSGRK